ncbi:AMP-binding protein [Nakamurella leprariae]|uniref:AMP-binding protein n=1 Tax=Nakamurella leprariae TaxID=2803911 RepID=A0A938Y720_9ACTN|nr:AMP-binding protein [Nakamurella leprariae]MBM9467221.1 AMP-binding protein [Nakamurella leprariae]
MTSGDAAVPTATGPDFRAHPWRRTVRRVPANTPADADAGLLARLRTVIAAQPDAVALVDDERSMTFGEVAELAARTARAVAGLSFRRWHPDADDTEVDPVAVLAAHRAETVAAVIGVIAAGSPVVVLDHALPHPRLLQYLEGSGARAVVHDPAHRDRAERLAAAAPAGRPLTLVPIPTGDALADPSADARARAGDLVPEGQPEPEVLAPAALVFTSGTTGRPKGVVYDHRLFPRSAWNVSVRDGTYDADDVLASVLPLGFSAGLDHTLAGLQVGARQHLRDLRAAGTGDVLAWLRGSGVTVVNTTPSMGRALVALVPDGERLADFRSLTLTSEAMHHSDAAALRAVLPPDCALSNRWGASETGLASVLPLVPGESGEPGQSGQLPVGWPVTELQLEVEPEQDSAPGTGVVTVTGRYIARRYWRDPVKTAESFAELPDGRRRFRSADVGRIDERGCFLLLGRRDHSVKVRSYLVEPGEVDAALFALPDIRESVVVGDDSAGRTRLVAYVVSTAEKPAAASVRSRLREVLPPWMVPETVVFLERLPRTERGKIDRFALPPAPLFVPGGTPPRTDWEGVVADLWARVLQLPEVGVHDDFFELGGDSLAAEELLALVAIELRIPDVDSQALLESATVAEFAHALQGGMPTDRRYSTLVPLRREGTGRPLFCLAGGGGLAMAFVPLVRHLRDDLPVWGLQAHGLEHRAVPDWSVEAAARRQVRALRSVQPHGPYRLLGHSFGAVLAVEVARQLTAAGETVDGLVVVDALPPGSRVPADRSRSRLLRARDVVGMLLSGIGPDRGQGQYPRFYRQARFLTRRYRPQPWTGRALVVAADGPDRDQRMAWGRTLNGPWSVVHLPGDHHSVLREPHVRGLARSVADFLERTDAAAADSDAGPQ